MTTIFTCPLMGTKHYNVQRVKEGDEVLLLPEPSNEFDANAIAVYNQKIEQIGYVRQRENTSEAVAKLLKGKPALAQISKIYEDEHSPIIFMNIFYIAVNEND